MKIKFTESAMDNLMYLVRECKESPQVIINNILINIDLEEAESRLNEQKEN